MSTSGRCSGTRKASALVAEVSSTCWPTLKDQKAQVQLRAWTAKLVLRTKANCDSAITASILAPGPIQVYGIVPNDKGMFVPGSRVRVRLTIGKPYKASLVPDTAILSDQDKRFVLIVDDKKTVRRRNVTLGAITDDGMRAIVPADKLAEGDDICASGK